MEEEQPETLAPVNPVSPDQPAHHDFFISATGQDQPWAAWIAAQLEATGATTFLESWDIRPGQNIVISLDQALANSEQALLLLSPAAFQDTWLKAQWAAVFRSDPTGAQRRLIPVLV